MSVTPATPPSAGPQTAAAPTPQTGPGPSPATDPTVPARPREIGGPKGPEPTRYGDWEQNGRCSDF